VWEGRDGVETRGAGVCGVELEPEQEPERAVELEPELESGPGLGMEGMVGIQGPLTRRVGGSVSRWVGLDGRDGDDSPRRMNG
jgi:hypothetical protein